MTDFAIHQQSIRFSLTSATQTLLHVAMPETTLRLAFAGPPGEKGEKGDTAYDAGTLGGHPPEYFAVAVIRRSDFVDPYSYYGKAPVGTAEADPGWSLTRLELDLAGNVVANLTATDSWANHLTATYS